MIPRLHPGLTFDSKKVQTVLQDAENWMCNMVRSIAVRSNQLQDQNTGDDCIDLPEVGREPSVYEAHHVVEETVSLSERHIVSI